VTQPGSSLAERISDPVEVADRWLARFSEALESRDAAALAGLFRADSYWRDLVAFSGQIRTVPGRDAVVDLLLELAPKIEPKGWRLAPGHTAPSVQPRGIEECIEAFIEFETAHTRALGAVRLTAADTTADTDLGVQAWAFMTAAQELKGFEEPIGPRRREHAVPHQFSGPNWQEHMDALRAFDGRDPEVVIVGAGQGGLCVAAGLRLAGVDVLTIERNERVGDNWRNRYHSLILHNLLSVNKMPYMSFPTTYPEYLPKDKFGGWLETYAEQMEIPVWTSTELLGGSFDEASKTWTLRINREGIERELRTRHVVVATGGGICAKPNMPHVPGIETFRGSVLHSSEAGTAGALRPANALVFGTGTSAHDIATQLHESGANVTMVQRNPTTIVSQKTANLYLQIFEERPAEEVDLIFNANSKQVTKDGFVAMTQIAADLDRELTRALEAAGFRTHNGIDDAGYFWDFLVRGGGYYINVGTSEMIVEGRIGLIQYADIDRFDEKGLVLTDGRTVPADVAVFATGYGNQQAQVRELFGDEVADTVGEIWDFGPDGEIRNTWRPTAAEGLWFVGGGIPHARNYGRYVALQIKARLEGLVQGLDPEAHTLWV
jgi:putative flavoprotein involved in K+ transport